MKPWKLVVSNIALSCCLLSAGFSHDVSASELVLVSSKAVDYEKFSPLELRKLYFGLSVKKNGQDVIGIRNISDDEAYQIFLQKVIHLSAKNYERRLISKTFRTGVKGVKSKKTLEKLLSALQSDKKYISFMWLADAKLQSNVKVIQTLWRREER